MRKPVFIARQGRRPSGFLGYIVAYIMASETVPENEITLDLLDCKADEKILEIGCGHGATLHDAAVRTEHLSLTGIDFSEVSLRVARHRNRKLIATGQIQLDLGDSANLPYSSEHFNKIYSVHTVYFWHQPDTHLQEIYRVMAPGGCFVLGFRSGDDAQFAAQFPASIYQIRPKADVKKLVQNAGFTVTSCPSKTVSGRDMYWIIAHKPSF